MEASAHTRSWCWSLERPRVHRDYRRWHHRHAAKKKKSIDKITRVIQLNRNSSVRSQIFAHQHTLPPPPPPSSPVQKRTSAFVWPCVIGTWTPMRAPEPRIKTKNNDEL